MSGQTEAQIELQTGGLTRDELADVIAVTREYAERELAPQALAVDVADSDALVACWRGVCEIGLDRGILGEADGGVGLTVAGLLAVVEELAVGEGGVATMALLANAAQALLPQDLRATLPAEARLALVPLPECGTPGSHSLKLEGDTANGQIRFALGGFGADGMVVVAHENHEHVVFFVDAKADGLTVTGEEDQMGLNGAPAAIVDFNNTPVRRIGGEEAAAAGLALANAGIAAVARGVARRARDIALDYTENRYQGGSMIIEYGAIIDMLARITERNRVIAVPAAFDGLALGDAGMLAQAIAAKTAATEAAADSTTDAVQACGGMGYMHETGLEKLMRDARYCQLFPQSNWLARDDLVTLERA